ncbi:MAG: hypothetical protein HYX60_04055 [Legionella longbeachae]|nr:hypothetical protein [Legionella longbeachae]
MKSTIQNILILILMLFGLSSFADKISIKGEPAVLARIGDVYYVPSTYVTSIDYNYVTIENSKKVCYVKPQTNLSALNVRVINVNIKGLRSQWTCYNYDETYFIATP